jgi:branched-chain amino acid transport system permease protein
MSRRDNEEDAVSRGVSLGRQRLVTPAASALFTGHAGAYGGFIPKPKSRP